MIDPPPSSTVIAVVGSPLTLSCTSHGSPPDTFTWRKDSGPVVNFTNITNVTYTSTKAVFRTDLHINNVTTSHSGTYTCIVTNPIGSNNLNITVVGKYLGWLRLQTMFLSYYSVYEFMLFISHRPGVYK